MQLFQIQGELEKLSATRQQISTTSASSQKSDQGTCRLSKSRVCEEANFCDGKRAKVNIDEEKFRLSSSNILQTFPGTKSRQRRS